MKGHYERHGYNLPILERFMLHVAKQENGCWNWTGSVKNPENPLGSYGQFKFRGKMERTHRVSWILYRGEVPEGLCVLHKCIGNRLCVNTEHLYIGTKAQNNADRKNQGRNGNHKGELNGRSKITEEMVMEIRSLRQPFMKKKSVWPYERLAIKFNVPRSTIISVVNLKSWKHLSS